MQAAGKQSTSACPDESRVLAASLLITFQQILCVYGSYGWHLHDQVRMHRVVMLPADSGKLRSNVQCVIVPVRTDSNSTPLQVHDTQDQQLCMSRQR
jgi:hypothetical protein